MDTKYKDDLFRKYVHFHESKVDASENKQCYNDDYLRTAASALLSLHKIDPCYRFRLIKFYEVAENSLKSTKSSNLHTLYEAIEMLETVGINLFLYPWKKEFKTIKCFQRICRIGEEEKEVTGRVANTRITKALKTKVLGVLGDCENECKNKACTGEECRDEACTAMECRKIRVTQEVGASGTQEIVHWEKERKQEACFRKGWRLRDPADHPLGEGEKTRSPF
ncbi:spermatogenesis-associated protein 2 isoform X3 [Pleurodeles waltl]|uniref:spermatogenesis-associated protein 2 isoform X3 n=1 Tax=Pleurodeles waltl TaxID=8319 RepID=UPI0037099BD3